MLRHLHRTLPNRENDVPGAVTAAAVFAQPTSVTSAATPCFRAGATALCFLGCWGWSCCAFITTTAERPVTNERVDRDWRGVNDAAMGAIVATASANMARCVVVHLMALITEFS